LIDWGFKFWRAANPDHVHRSAPVLRDLNFASRACFEELAAESGNEFELVQRGLLMLCKTQHALDDEAKFAGQANALGLPAEVLDARATAVLDPDVTMDIAGAVYFPKDCHLTPARFMATLHRLVANAGVKFVWGADVSGWKISEGRLRAASTTRGEFEADEFVVCGGSWSPGIVRDLGLRIPIQAGKGYSLTLPRPPQLPRLCSIFTEARLAVTPMGASLRIGGTMEIAGLNESITNVRVQGIIKSVPKYFPRFSAADFSGVQPWRGLRPCSPDGLPYIGRTGKFANLTLATGHAMMGLSLGPITGRLVAEILAGEKTSIDIALLNPDRYA
jgi:D-amino-acid dehydrogenase